MEHSRAQVIATLGPASRDAETIKRMIQHQMDVARLNFSWGTYAEHALYIKTVREIAQKLEKRIPIIQDLSGPRLQEKKGHGFDVSIKQTLTKKDLADLDFGLKHAVDYIALSYVGSPEDINELKRLIKESGQTTLVIAKIERKKAVDDLDGIIEVSDAIMIARGDLGHEVPLEKIPWLEEEIIQKCKKAGKPVITATQMLLSMTENPEPTKAEITDVFFAISNGSDAVMLSEETATGKYPVEAVMMMEKITLEAEKLHQFKVNRL